MQDTKKKVADYTTDLTGWPHTPEKSSHQQLSQGRIRRSPELHLFLNGFQPPGTKVSLLRSMANMHDAADLGLEAAGHV